MTLQAAFGIVVVLATMVGQSSGQVAWPAIQPFSTSVPVQFSASQVHVDIPLRDLSGHERYHFACRGGQDAYLGSLDGNWVPPLMCTLSEGTRATEESLLAEDDVAAWHTRGQFHEKELVGDCGKYPEFGAHRSFRLRGFRLSLDARDIRLDKNGVAQSFVLAISVAADSTAQSRQAERPGFLDPRVEGTDCKVIRRGAEPRMCRDWTRGGSWDVCK